MSRHGRTCLQVLLFDKFDKSRSSLDLKQIIHSLSVVTDVLNN